MDATDKCGNAGYGYGYVSSKPQMHSNYRSHSTESVTTAITEINHMSANEKGDALIDQDQASNRGYHGDGGMQKHSAYKEEVLYEGVAASVKNHGYKQEKYCEEDGGYGAHYGAAATTSVKKQGYKQLDACGETGTGHLYGAGAVQTYAYDQQETCGQICRYAQDTGMHSGAAKKESYKDESHHQCDTGNGSHYVVGAVQKYGYTEHDKYGGAALYTPQKYEYMEHEKYAGAATFVPQKYGYNLKLYRDKRKSERESDSQRESDSDESNCSGGGNGQGRGCGAPPTSCTPMEPTLSPPYKFEEEGRKEMLEEEKGKKNLFWSSILAPPFSDCKGVVPLNRIHRATFTPQKYGYTEHKKHVGAATYMPQNYVHNLKPQRDERESDSDDSDCEGVFPPRGDKYGGAATFAPPKYEYTQHKKYGGAVTYAYGYPQDENYDGATIYVPHKYGYTQQEKYDGAATYAPHKYGWMQHEKYNGVATYAHHKYGWTQHEKYNGAATYAPHKYGWTQHEKYNGAATYAPRKYACTEHEKYDGAATYALH
ncbi:unnamed protein product [Urochloa humidicola]